MGSGRCRRGRVGRRSGPNGSSSVGSGGGCGSVRPGGMSRSATALESGVCAVSPLAAGGRVGAGGGRAAAPGGRSRADLLGVGVDSTIARAHRHAAGARTRPDGQAELLDEGGGEPADRALGRSRGGLTTKIHLSCEQGRWCCRCWSPPSAGGLAAVSACAGADRGAAGGAGGAPHPP